MQTKWSAKLSSGSPHVSEELREDVVEKSVVVGEVEVTSSINMAGGTGFKPECELEITSLVIDSDGVSGNAG